MALITDSLAQYGPRTCLVEEDRPFLADDLLRAAASLSSQIRATGSAPLIVWSARARDLIAALCAATWAECDVYIAHRTMPRAFVDDLADERGAGLILADTPDIVWRTPSRTKGRGRGFRVHLMTSGTTGRPKIAAYTVGALAGRIRCTASSARARWLLTYPVSSFAGVQVMLSAILGRGALVVPRSRTPDGFVEAAVRHQVTHVSGTPTFWRSFLLAMPANGSSVRQVTLGGELVDQPTLDRLRLAFPLSKVTHIYASTEAGALFAVSDGRAGFPAAWLDGGVDGVRLRIRDGVLEVRSPRRMVSYVSGDRDPTTVDGWLSTGDLVSVRGDRVFFEGRSDRRINVGGFKVAPEEVEAALLEISGVADVRVFGVPSPLSGNVLVAEVVSTGGQPEELRRRVLEQARLHLESYKVPRIVRVVPRLALEGSGKKGRAAELAP